MKKTLFPKLQNIVSKDTEYRLALCYAIIQDGYVVATDCHVLVKIDLNDWLDEEVVKAMEGFALDINTLKTLSQTKWKDIKVNDSIITLREKNGNSLDLFVKYRFTQNQTFADSNGNKLTYVDYNAVIPSESNETEMSKIGLSTKRLNEVSEALGTINGVKLTFNGHNKAIIVRPNAGYFAKNSKSLAIVMPIATK